MITSHSCDVGKVLQIYGYENIGIGITSEAPFFGDYFILLIFEYIFAIRALVSFLTVQLTTGHVL